MNEQIYAQRTQAKSKYIHQDGEDELLRQSLPKKVKVLIAHELPESMLLFKKAFDLLWRQTRIRRGLVVHTFSQFLDNSSGDGVARYMSTQHAVEAEAG